MEIVKEKLKSIKNGCDKINRIVKFIIGILVLLIILYIVYTVIVIFTPEDSFSTYMGTDSSFCINNCNTNLAVGSVIPYGFYPPDIGRLSYSAKSLYIFNLIISMFFLLAPIGYILLSISKMLASVYNEGKLFSQENVKRLRILAILLIAIGMGYKAIYVLLSAAFVFGFEHIIYGIDPNFTPVIVGLFVLILAQIFDYGRLLQVQYDETI